MQSKLKPPTKSERIRMHLMKHDLGCIVTRIKRGIYAPPDIHHILDGGRRLGHAHTIPLTPWYHRGIITTEHTTKEMLDMFGPSMALDKRAFEKKFGTESELLKLTDYMIYEMLRDIA